MTSADSVPNVWSGCWSQLIETNADGRDLKAGIEGFVLPQHVPGNAGELV
jgi:hypothetical protein